MFQTAKPLEPSSGCDVAVVLERLASASSRPRYAFMVLNLIAQVARPDGRAGPWIKRGTELISLRDWLCDALRPMAQRGPRAAALFERVRIDLDERGLLPDGDAARRQAIEAEAHARVRTAGKSNLSRAVSELVSAGLLHRHYQGYRIDHHNRGGQRHAVYTLIGDALRLLPAIQPKLLPSAQGELVLVE